jgi:uncharacterized protein (TIGR02266 family)
MSKSDADEAGERAPSSGRGRAPTNIEIELTPQSESNFYWGLVEDVTKAGVFVATHMTERVGTEIRISVTLSPLGRTVHANGVVRWVRDFLEHSEAPAGMGVQLGELGSDEIAAIKEFVAERPPMFFDAE